MMLVIVLAAAVPVSAEDAHVRASLVSDAGAIEPGTSFGLGVLFEPEPGWHIYWRNPGEAGLATEVVFDLPTGFETGEVEWPAPVFFKQSGELAGYGYEDPVVLGAEIEPPAGAPVKTQVRLEASWLACKNECVLESAVLSAELPLVGAEFERSKAALTTWRRTVPVEHGAAPYTVSVTGGTVPETGAAELVVWLSWPEAPGRVEFFPDPGPGLKVEHPRVQTRGTLTRVDLTVSRLNNSSDRASDFRSLVVVTDGDGERSATVTYIELDRRTP